MENSPSNIQPSFQKEPRKDRKSRPRRRTIHIRDIFLLLWDKKLLILVSVGAVVTITAIYTIRSPKLYKATTRLVIEKETLNLFPSSKNILAVDTTTADYYNTQYRIMKSRTLAQKVIKALRLKVTATSGTERDMYHGELLRKMIVSPVRETRLVDVSVVDNDPKQAADIANAVAQEFIKLNVESKLEARKAAAQTIKKQLEEVASQVQEAERRFNEFKSRYNIVSTNEKQSLIHNDLIALTEVASQTKLERSAAEAVYNRIKDLPLEELKRQKEIVTDTVVQQLEVDYQGIQRGLETLSRRYGDKHPRIVDQKALIEGIQRDIDARTEGVREMLRSASLAAQEKEAKAIQAVDEAKKRLHEFDAIATEYARHEMDVQSNKKTYEALLSRSMESVVETGATRVPSEWGGGGTSNIRVIDRAVLGAPFRPRPVVNMCLATFVGLALGCGSAFFLVYLDDKVRNPDDVTEDIGRALVAEIPLTRGRLVPERAKGRITYDDPDSAISEAYRNLRTSIQLMARDGRFPSLLVTSACHGEGKTTTASNLGITVAQAGRKVLLVDTDMRRPRMHKHFGIDESRGLIKCFSGESSLEDALVDRSELARPKRRKDKTAPLQQGELWILPCGERRVFNPTEVIGSQRMQEIVAELKKRFDVLIFDSPPCRFSDPLILSKLADGVLVVVEAGKFPKSLIVQGLENLDRVEGTKVFGVALNKYNPKKSGSYGYYGYRSYYYDRYYDRHYYYHRYDRRRKSFWHRLFYRPSTKKTATSKQKPPPPSPSGDTPARKSG